MLASFNLWQWHYTIIRGMHEHCIAADVIGSRKTTLTPMIQICPSDLTIPFKLCRRVSDQHHVCYDNQYSSRADA